jgi:hypothetical protein
MRTTLVYIATIVLFLSTLHCKKEKIIMQVSTPKSTWQVDSFLQGSFKWLTASLPIDDTILMVSNRLFTAYINSKKPNTPINGLYIPGATTYYSLFSPPSLGKWISVSVTSPDRLFIYASYNPSTPMGLAEFNPVYSNAATSVKGLSFPGLGNNPGYPVINSKYILAPTEIDYTGKKGYASLITLNTITGPGLTASVSISNVRQLELIPPPSTIGFATNEYFSAAYFGKFFVFYHNQFFRIDTLGNIKAFGYSPEGNQGAPIVNMFTVGSLLFARGGGKIFVSHDQGETWSVFINALGSIYLVMTYFNIGNDLYATLNSQIAKVELRGSDFHYIELDNDGLQTHQITSLNRSGKYIFATTYSGLFYRDTTGFNTPKK